MRPSSLKYAFAFALLGVGSVAGLVRYWPSPWALAFLPVAIAFLIAGAAYGARRPTWLGKQHDGKLAGGAWVLLAPLYLLNRLSLLAYRWAEKGSPWCEVQPNLFWGRRLVDAECRAMPADQVLDLTSEFSECETLRGRGYCAVPMLDGTAPSQAQLAEALHRLKQQLAEGPTYVHCALGHGRSGTVVLAYLIDTGVVTSIQQGLALLRSHRPGATLSSGQRAAASALFA